MDWRPDSPVAVAGCVSALVVIFWIDYETFLIPVSAALIIGLAGVAGDAWHVWQGTATLSNGALIEGYSLLPAPLPSSILAMVASAAFLWLLRELFSWIYGREAMGFGDVFLVAGIAANIGWSSLLGTFFFLSVMLGALIGILLRVPHAVRAYRWATARAAKASVARASIIEAPAIENLEAGAPQAETPEDGVPEAETPGAKNPAETPAELAVFDTPLVSTAVDGQMRGGASGVGDANSDSDIDEADDCAGMTIGEDVQIPSTCNQLQWKSLAWPLARHAFRKSIPFGPMLAMGAIVTLLYGAQLNQAYLDWVNGPSQPGANVPRASAAGAYISRPGRVEIDTTGFKQANLHGAAPETWWRVLEGVPTRKAFPPGNSSSDLRQRTDVGD
jgi:prepilin signal peptidase PulO-like enzyme (type II secretory pathway)